MNIAPVSPARPKLWLLILLGALAASPPVSVDMYLPAIPQMAAALQASSIAVSLTLSLFFVGMGLGQLQFGPWSDRVGRRMPLLAGLALYMAASIGCAMATSVTALIILRFLQAFGGCAGVVIARAYVRDRFDPQTTAQVFSYLALVSGLAPILAPIFGGFVLLVGDWRTIFFIQAGFGAICALAVYFRLPESRTLAGLAHAQAEKTLESFRALAADRQVLVYLLVGSLCMGMFFGYIAISSSLLIEAYGVSPQTYSWIFAANGLGVILASALNRWLLSRYSYSAIMRGAVTFGFFASLLLFFSALTSLGGLLGVLIPLFFVVCTNGLTMGNSMTGAVASQPQRAGAAAALAGCTQAVAGAIFAGLVGYLYDGSPLAMASVMLFCMAVAAIACRMLPRGL